MNRVTIVVPLELDKETVEVLSQALNETGNKSLKELLYKILCNVHYECERIGKSLCDLDKYNPCSIWKRI